MKRVSGRAIYAGTMVAIVALVAGFVAASVAITNTTQNAEGNYVNASGAVTGLTYQSTELTSVTGSPAASTGTPTAVQALASGGNTFCATTCVNGDPSEDITYGFDATLAGSIEISVNVIAAGTTTAILYLSQAATPTTGTILIVVDVGTTTSSISSVTVTAQQCASANCP